MPKTGSSQQFSLLPFGEYGPAFLKILDCWFEHFAIEEYLRETLTSEEWESTFQRTGKNKVISLLELIEQAKNRKQNDTERGLNMECNKEKNLKRCNCTYEPCSRKGICCECIAYHLRARELPGCCFSEKAETTYDRSFEYFARLVDSGGI